MAINRRVGGLARLNRQIRALPEIQKRAARETLAENATELAEAIRRAAPEDTGALKRSIGWSRAGEAPAGSIAAQTTDRQRALGAEGLAVTVHAGDREAYYARWVEHGRSASAAEGPRRNLNFKRTLVMTAARRAVAAAAAQPFFWPTIRASTRRLRSRVVRASNKAAKLAAATP